MYLENTQISQPKSCPDHERLEAFFLGSLTDQEMTAITEHLEVCDPCTSTVDSISTGDSLISKLRAPNPLKDYAQEVEYQNILQQLEYDVTVACVEPISRASQAEQTESVAGDIGNYQLIEKIACGGMGIVYRARQRNMRRDVALKMISPNVRGDESWDRFQVEVNAIARLQHPHVLQVFESGVQQEKSFFTMELMEGGNLATRLKQGAMSQKEASELVRDLAEAVHYCHLNGVLHRDLKPSNVLFTKENFPKIGDFGLAKIFDNTLTDLQNLTQTDVLLGTPSYMAPEQARGAHAEIGPASDVYGLGAILYCTLTGKPPFAGMSKLETIERVRSAQPLRPSSIKRNLSPGLEAICLKCLEKSPANRYQSAKDLADDLKRWIAGECSQALKIRRWRSQRRWLVGLASAIALGGVAFSIPRPESPIEKSQKHLRDLHGQLSKRQQTVIVAAKGLPGWYEWIGETDVAELKTNLREGGTTLRSQGTTMLKLLDAPQCNSYRLEADLMHHQVGGRVSAVGLFVGHWQAEANGKTVNVCSLLRFNEFLDEQAAHALYVKNIKGTGLPTPPAPLGNSVRLCPYVLVNRRGKFVNDFELAGSSQQYQRDPSGPWRHLVVEFRPQSVRAYFENNPIAMELSKSEFEDSTQSEIRNDTIRVNGARPVFNPQGAIGVFVKDGAMSFRNVFLRPL